MSTLFYLWYAIFAFSPVPSSYCKIKVDGKSVETPTEWKTANPEWNSRATFYTASKHPKVTVEVASFLYKF